MRGTLHIVAAEDLGWMLNLTRERQVRGSATRRNGLELSDRDLEIAREAAIVALTGRLCLTRDQLYECSAWQLPTIGSTVWSEAVKPCISLRKLAKWRMVRDGEVVGTWKRSRSKPGALVSTPFAELSSRSSREFTRAAADFARFLDKTHS